MRYTCPVTIEEIESRLRVALRHRAGVRFAIVFGSSVTRGSEAPHDVDLALSFAHPLSLFERGRLAGALEDELGRPVDVVDLDEASTLLRWEVVRTGRVVLAEDREALLAFQARVPIEFFDLRPYLDREAAGLRDALRKVAWSASTS
jgi:predicted nucleotidyltransferase